MVTVLLASSGHAHFRHRRGSTITELIVAAGLLVTSTSLLATSSVAALKLNRLERYQAVASDELANQLERLLALPADEVTSALANLELSNWAQQTLPQASLSGSVVADAHGRRLVLHIDWARSGDAKPLVAVGWLSSTPPAATDQLRAARGGSDEV